MLASFSNEFSFGWRVLFNAMDLMNPDTLTDSIIFTHTHKHRIANGWNCKCKSDSLEIYNVFCTVFLHLFIYLFFFSCQPVTLYINLVAIVTAPTVVCNATNTKHYMYVHRTIYIYLLYFNFVCWWIFAVSIWSNDVDGA